MTTGVAAMAAGYAAFRYMSSPKSANHAYFDGKVVWVPGASSGIGKELCKQLVEKSKGVRLILSSRKEETLREVKEELVAAGARAKDVAIVTLDLGDKETLEAAVERAFKAFGSVDVLVNNAGISQRSLARMTSPVVYDRLMEVDYVGQVYLTQRALHKMVETKVSLLPLADVLASVLAVALFQDAEGHIVFISSVAGKIPVPFRSGYCAAKVGPLGQLSPAGLPPSPPLTLPSPAIATTASLPVSALRLRWTPMPAPSGLSSSWNAAPSQSPSSILGACGPPCPR